MINGGVMGGPPVLVGPGQTSARVTEVVCFLNIGNVWVRQLQEVLGSRLLAKISSRWILDFSF